MGDRRLVTVDSHECLPWQKQHSMISGFSISVPFKKPSTDWNIKFCSQTKTVLEILQSEWLQVNSINYSTKDFGKGGA